MCFGHATNLAVKAAMSTVHIKATKIRSLLNSMLLSVKRKDLFESLSLKTDVNKVLPNLDYQKRWLSKFTIIQNAFDGRRVLSADTNHVDVLRLFKKSEADWRGTKKPCQFLEGAAAATEHPWSEQHDTLSVSVRLFRKLRRRHIKVVSSGDSVLTPVAEVITRKWNTYNEKICSDFFDLVPSFDLLFESDSLKGSDVLTELKPTKKIVQENRNEVSVLDGQLSDDSSDCV